MGVLVGAKTNVTPSIIVRIDTVAEISDPNIHVCSLLDLVPAGQSQMLQIDEAA